MNPFRAVAFALLVLLLAAPCPVQAIPFCMAPPSLTWREEAAGASMILYGTLCNAQANQDGGGTTDLVLASVLKTHPILGDQKVLQLPRYIPIDNAKEPPRYFIFCDVFKGKIDPYRGIAVGPAAVGYLTGSLALGAVDRAGLIRYCFDYLEHADAEIAEDAFQEFRRATDAELAKAARKGWADKLRGWLRNAQTPPSRLGMYAFLLAHCGNGRDADLLGRLARQTTAQGRTGHGILAGYVLLNPREGWTYLRTLLKDVSQPFPARYSALRVARYFFTTRTDVIEKKEVIAAVSLLLDQPDIADLPIDDLRKWRCWDLTDRVLAMAGRPSHNIPIIRRAAIRYALQCPGAAATAFVREQRKTNPTLVADMEELLRLEGDEPASQPLEP
jgi:hypothetical protein